MTVQTAIPESIRPEVLRSAAEIAKWRVETAESILTVARFWLDHKQDAATVVQAVQDQVEFYRRVRESLERKAAEAESGPAPAPAKE